MFSTSIHASVAGRQTPVRLWQRLAFMLGTLSPLFLASSPATAASPGAPSVLCIDDSCLETPQSNGIKWHPGHYMLVFLGDSQQQHFQQFDEIGRETAIKGVKVRFYWADLEPRKNFYDFSVIEAYLEKLQSLPVPKRLIISVQDRRFNSTNADGIVPDYLLNEPEYNGGVTRNVTGYVARVWEKPVMDRVIALHQALAARFDGEPYFEGINTEETTVSFGSGITPPASYSRGALAVQLKRLISSARVAWQHTNINIYTNFLSGEIEGIIKHAAANQAGVGGPDVLPPPHEGTDGDRIIRGEVGGTDYRTLIPVVYDVQTPQLGGKEGTFTPQQLYSHAVSTQGANYMIWIRNTMMGGDAQRWSTGILPFIRSVGGRTRSGCPSSFETGCITE